ncbi:restriction endonuclease [Afifella sp. IM 167]|nr:restriction endonuclease [Afifella sp. IM 167]
MKAIFTTKIEPTYDDLPEKRYHFPRTYLRQAENAVGDWIIYYEPRRASGDLASRGGRQAYFATARVTSVAPDPLRPDHFYAFVEHYLDFARPVPFREGEHYYEQALRKEDGSTNKGASGRAVRNLPDSEYALILGAAFATLLEEPGETFPAADLPGELPLSLLEFSDQPQAAFEPETQDRPWVRTVHERRFRDRAFSATIKRTYQDTCAFTGIKIINGGGRSEVQAAHIRPVADDGPDSVRNGIALSGTAHWMFDRGLISVDDDYSLLVAESSVPESVARMLTPDRRLLLPERPDLRPHPQFLRYHRETVFKG